MISEQSGPVSVDNTIRRQADQMRSGPMDPDREPTAVPTESITTPPTATPVGPVHIFPGNFSIARSFLELGTGCSAVSLLLEKA